MLYEAHVIIPQIPKKIKIVDTRPLKLLLRSKDSSIISWKLLKFSGKLLEVKNTSQSFNVLFKLAWYVKNKGDELSYSSKSHSGGKVYFSKIIKTIENVRNLIRNQYCQ